MAGTWGAAAAGLDTATAVCASFNLIYFLFRLTGHRGETAARLVATFALALVSLGVIGESLLFLAILVAPAGEHSQTGISWTLIRLAPLSGAVTISLLILRRLYFSVWSEEDHP